METPVILGKGKIDLLGLTINDLSSNFAVFAPNARQAALCLFQSSENQPDAEIPLFGPDQGIWHIEIRTPPPEASYLYRIDGQYAADPYAKSFAEIYQWGDFSKCRIPYRCQINSLPPFDWQRVSSPNISVEDLIIYEMHVRGFTIHPSSNIKKKGSYAGIIEKIDYLKELNINAIELMPVFEFDETHSSKIYSAIHETKLNYWGYNPISFFIPMNRFAYDQKNTINEFKTMVRELHRAKIEIILDVVFNHTGEGSNYPVSFRCLDHLGYYMVDEFGNDRNFTGCGNTFQTNGETSQKIILDSLRYWVKEMHIDGFRFDLASIMTRACNGTPLTDPPLLKAIAQDPILKTVKLIAEPWDAAGLNQVGQFHQWGPWIEWKGMYRDHVRRFINGYDNETGMFATCVSGNQPTFPFGSPLSGINFITAHDGYSLRDLVSYQHKHNIDNGENNRDGADQNFSWNCGVEGPTQDPSIHELRERQMRNFWLVLLLSQGIPMVLMGDEIGHTRKGNNNPYVQDNEINWFNWDILKTNHSMQQFVSSLIKFRKNHPSLRKKQFLKDEDVEWHGHTFQHPDWKAHSHFIAYTLKGTPALYAAFNASPQKATVTLPLLENGKKWQLLVDTQRPWNDHYLDQLQSAPELGESIEMLSRSAILAINPI